MNQSGIPFNIPLVTGKESGYIEQVLQSGYFAGDGPFTRACQAQLSQITACKEVLLTTSCTHALEMAALLCDIKAGDEVIMPSFTFVSTANAFALRGAHIVFVDLDPNTMNVDPSALAAAVSPKTKAIVIMHYAGVACDMEAIVSLCKAHQLYLIEDAAHCIEARYKGQHLGTFGHLGTFSFHHTKNIHCGEGGALLVNDEELAVRAMTIRDKGTNRQAFLKGKVQEYSWVDIGSSYLLNELSAAFLYGQLEVLQQVNQHRLLLWQAYFQALSPLAAAGKIRLPEISQDCQHNGHLFYFLCDDQAERDALLAYLKIKAVSATFHYVPLHNALAGKKWGRFHGKDQFTDRCSHQLIRLPIYYDLKLEDCHRISDLIKSFYAQS